MIENQEELNAAYQEKLTKFYGANVLLKDRYLNEKAVLLHLCCECSREFYARPAWLTKQPHICHPPNLDDDKKKKAKAKAKKPAAKKPKPKKPATKKVKVVEEVAKEVAKTTSAEMIIEICKQYTAGVSIYEIAETLNITLSEVNYRLTLAKLK